FAFGVGFWNTYGGQLEYDRFDSRQIPALNETQNAVLELVPGVAYQVNDVLSLGLAFRLGYGLFHVDTTAKPSDANLDGNGFGAGAAIGVMVTPGERVSLGAVYRTPLTNKVTGSGTLLVGNNLSPLDFQLQQRWPQSAAV